MSVVGNNSAPSLNYDFANRTGAQAASYFIMPSPGGSITDIHVYCYTYSGSSEAGWLCIWNGSGGLEVQASATIPGSQGWVSATLSTPYFVSSGTGIFIGVQVDSSAGVQIHYGNASSTNKVDVGWNSTIPSALANFVQHGSSEMGAYGNYTPSEGWINQGSSGSPNWVAGELVLFDGSAWQNPSELAANTGSSGSPVWTQAQ